MINVDRISFFQTEGLHETVAAATAEYERRHPTRRVTGAAIVAASPGWEGKRQVEVEVEWVEA